MATDTMSANHHTPPLAWLQPDDDFPPVDMAWGHDTPHPGLLAAGGVLDSAHLQQAYRQGIFPWFSEGSPILWWSTDPRMVLQTADFRLHRSLKQAIRKFEQNPNSELRIDSDFAAVIAACSQQDRPGQDGTWIVDDIQAAYTQLHRDGFAHSVELWQRGRLVAGLYCVAIGRAVFGESMFTTVPNGSKIALAALVQICRREQAPMIDCQQNTGHLAFMGAAEIPRSRFVAQVRTQIALPPMRWEFASRDWTDIIPLSEMTSPHPDE
ncbi:MAG: leucyl/phenylalanyl-tRNA--protein transferase [Comamonas sp.]|jgi:leucyl/phenylalanyl-tRNA--protein transferase|nr:leucyl/phenylalanyl-tRNA--protein transferase [Comamonas sp.]